MFKHYLKISWRTLAHNRTYSLINVLGLALGIAAFVALLAYVRFEKSYDDMHAAAENIYRVESRFYKNGRLVNDWATSTNGYAGAMKDNLPGIRSFVRINFYNSERVVRQGNRKFREEHVAFADTSFFSFFSYPLLKGDVRTVLKEVNTIVLSESTAKKYFGNADPVGKYLEISAFPETIHCMVTGVFRDMPANSTLQLNFLLSWASSPAFVHDFWYQHESYTFLRLKPGMNPVTIEYMFPALAEKYKTAEAFRDLAWGVHLVPLKEIHLNDAKPYEIETKGNRKTVNMLYLMAFIILVIANINYINLSTAKAMERAREVGVRKVSGARSAQLIVQFLFESLLINGLALCFAAAMLFVAGFVLRLYPDIGNAYHFLLDAPTFLLATCVLLVGILLSGLFPATVLSSVNPIFVLKGRYLFSPAGALMRKALVILQFAFSVMLIAGTVAIYRQLSFMQNQKLGVQINQILVIKAPVNTPAYAQKIHAFKERVKQIAGVQNVTGSGSVPGREVGKSLSNSRYGTPGNEQRSYEMLMTDFEFIDTYGLELVAGRKFDKNRPADSTALVLNEVSVKQFGFASNEAAIGQKVWLEANHGKPNQIIGVIKNYHQQSLRQDYTPFILFLDPDFSWIPKDYYSLKIHSANPKNTLSSVRTIWNELFPESSFDSFFLNEFYNRQYRQEIRFNQSFMVFSGLAIFIACMGLFGLTAYITARRTREIGVRKVLGASVQRITVLLTWDVIRLILVSGLVAIPPAYFIIHNWLNQFAFRATITWWQFIVPVVVLLVIAVLTIGFLIVKATLASPIRSLRSE